MARSHNEAHLVARIGWLRAAVLGANDGIISTASLILGVASAAVSQNHVLLTGVAGLVAGAMSMAAGEYVLGQLAVAIPSMPISGASGGNSPRIRHSSRMNSRVSMWRAASTPTLLVRWRASS